MILSIFLQEGVKEEGSRVRAVLMFMNFVGNDFISNRFVCKRFTVQTLLWSTECDNRKDIIEDQNLTQSFYI